MIRHEFWAGRPWRRCLVLLSTPDTLPWSWRCEVGSFGEAGAPCKVLVTPCVVREIVGTLRPPPWTFHSLGLPCTRGWAPSLPRGGLPFSPVVSGVVTVDSWTFYSLAFNSLLTCPRSASGSTSGWRSCYTWMSPSLLEHILSFGCLR